MQRAGRGRRRHGVKLAMGCPLALPVLCCPGCAACSACAQPGMSYGTPPGLAARRACQPCLPAMLPGPACSDLAGDDSEEGEPPAAATASKAKQGTLDLFLKKKAGAGSSTAAAGGGKQQGQVAASAGKGKAAAATKPGAPGGAAECLGSLLGATPPSSQHTAQQVLVPCPSVRACPAACSPCHSRPLLRPRPWPCSSQGRLGKEAAEASCLRVWCAVADCQTLHMACFAAVLAGTPALPPASLPGLPATIATQAAALGAC